MGFVALHASYLEEAIDRVLWQLDPIEPYSEKKQKWQISQKIKHAKKILKRLCPSQYEAERIDALIQDLTTCLSLFEDRNELIHGRIYANFDRPPTLKSGRPNTADREVGSKELYKLASKFENLGAAILRPTIFNLSKAINQHLAKVER